MCIFLLALSSVALETRRGQFWNDIQPLELRSFRRWKIRDEDSSQISEDSRTREKEIHSLDLLVDAEIIRKHLALRAALDWLFSEGST